MAKAYDVGYRKPPKSGQFKPGGSGNPKGRPKSSLNLKTDLEEELAERISIREGPRQLKISKQRAMVKALVAKSLKGDARSATILIGLIGKLMEVELTIDADLPLPEEDLAIIANFLKRKTSDD